MRVQPKKKRADKAGRIVRRAKRCRSAENNDHPNQRRKPIFAETGEHAPKEHWRLPKSNREILILPIDLARGFVTFTVP
jgi:hypothetical protein